MRKTTSSLLILLLLLSVTVFVSAQEQPVVSPPLAVDVPGTGIIFMRLRVPVGGMSLFEMRDLIWERLTAALRPGLESGEPLDGTAVSIRFPEGKDPQIFVGEHLIVEVDREHALVNQSTQEALAEVWASNLALALDRWAEINRAL